MIEIYFIIYIYIMSNNVLSVKKDVEYSNAVKDVFNLISYNHRQPLVMGSNSMRFKYASDYDLFSVVISKKTLDGLKKEVSAMFKKMMKNIKSRKDDIYFIEFMCGVDENKNPLKWSIDEVIKGYKDKYKLMDVLDEYSIIKIEIVAYINNEFIPFSDVFHFQIGSKGVNQAKITLDTVPSLSKEVKKYYEAENYMKVLKRLFIISQVKKNKNDSEKLINIFESDIGMVYKVKSDITTILKVLSLYKDKTTLSRVAKTIDILKEKLTKQTKFNFNSNLFIKFDKVSKSKSSKSMIKYLSNIENSLLQNVNNELKKEIKKNKISFKEFLES